MAANQVSVATPGPAGVPGLTFEGLWVDGSVYQVRDLVRFTDGNLYVVNVQHTASSLNTPILDLVTWSLFINADDAFQWAAKAKHLLIGDSLGNVGYSALHQAAKAQDWARLTTDAVTNDTNTGDVGYSAKAWAIGGTEVTTTASRGAAKEWAVGSGLIDTADYSAKELAQGSVLAAGGSAKNWAQLATTPTTTATDASAKEWAIGVSTHKNDGSSKTWATTAKHTVVPGTAVYSSKHFAAKATDWASLTTDAVTNDANDADVDYSAKAWAIGGTEVTTTASRGASKEWATKTNAAVDTSEFSAKAYAIGGTGITDTAGKGAAKEWAIETSGNVDGTSYSSKEYAAGTQASTGGSSKDYAQYTGGGVRGATSDHSAKAWSVGGTGVTTTSAKGAAKEWATSTGAAVDTSEFSAKAYAIGGTGITTSSGKGAAKEWATTTGGYVDTAEYSAKEYAIGTTVAVGSAKDWAVLAEDSVVTGSSYSALHHAAKGAASATAAAASETSANASADAVASYMDAFDDKYLGAMSDAVVLTASSDAGLLITSAAHGLVDTQIIRVVNTGGALPGNLSASTDYYVRDQATNTFRLATSSGGTAIAYSSAGSGTNTWYYADFATPSSSSWAKNSSTITVASNVGVRIGQVVSGTGIATSPKPNVLSISGVSIVISDNMAAAGSSVAVTFANKGVFGTFNVAKDGPATDNDGDALVDGMLYFNTTDDVMKVYDVTGTAWKQLQPTTAEQTAINTVSASIVDVNTFAVRYRIASSAPGSSLDTGDLYWNTTANELYAYGGGAWNITSPNAANQANIDIVAGELIYLEDLGGIADAVLSTSGNNITDVADNETNINLVAAQIAHVATLGPIAGNITTVAGISANTTTVAGIAANVTTVAGIAANVTSVAGDASDIGAVAAKATEIGRLGTADAVADMALLGTTACVADMALLGTSDCVADLAILGTSDIVADLAILATTDIVADLAILATTDVVADLAILGTADVVVDLNTLGTADVVTDMNTLGTGGNVTNMNTLAGIAANITTVAGVSGNVTTVAGISANVTTVAGVHANVTTVAGSIADVNRYAAEYTIASSAPGSPDEGDLWYDSTNNVLKYHTGSAFAAIAAGIGEVADDTSPTLGGDLDVDGNDLTNVGEIGGANLNIDFGSIA